MTGDPLIRSVRPWTPLGGGSRRSWAPARGLAGGTPADLVVVPGDTVTAAVVDRAPRTLVVHADHFVAADGEVVRSARGDR